MIYFCCSWTQNENALMVRNLHQFSTNCPFISLPHSQYRSDDGSLTNSILSLYGLCYVFFCFHFCLYPHFLFFAFCWLRFKEFDWFHSICQSLNSVFSPLSQIPFYEIWVIYHFCQLILHLVTWYQFLCLLFPEWVHQPIFPYPLIIYSYYRTASWA